MTRSRFVFTAIVVMLILSFTFSSVAADTQPPVQPGTVDEDGDLVVEVLPPSLVDSPAVMPGTDDLTLLNEEDVSADGLVIVDTAPVYPTGNEWLYTKTPTFYFSKDAGATKYKIEVWDAYSGIMVYTYKGAGNCDAVQCWFTPDTNLKNFDINGLKGHYAWRVKAKVAGLWQPAFSSFAYFYVLSSGFTSTFTTDAKKWIALYGEWFLTDSGYLKTKGVTDLYSSVVQKEYFSDNDSYYVYEVVMKRKTYNYNSNRIYVAAFPDNDPENGWGQGYEFGYWDNGDYFLNSRNDDSTYDTLCSGSNPAIVNENGWNKLTIWQNYPWLSTWINEEIVCDIYIGDDSLTLRGGYVGIMEYGWPQSNFLVDKAKVKYSNAWPYSSSSLDAERVQIGVPDNAAAVQDRIDGVTP